MLNIYEGVLKLTNVKLYNSPYKININEVGKVLKKFKLKSRLIYLKNLTNLNIEEVSEKELNLIAPNSKAVYNSFENKILLIKNINHSEILNHELFHSTSNRKSNKNKRRSGIIISDNTKVLGKYLNEGITEYLNLKSKNLNESLSRYQLELFVIEFLVFIYGENFINYYFQNNGVKFFRYFSQNKKKIKKIDSLLTESHTYDLLQKNRLKYLYVTLNVQNDIELNNELQLNSNSNTKINELVSKELFFHKTQEQNYNFFNLLSKDEIKKNIYIKWNIEYKTQKRKTFEIILESLLDIAYDNGYSNHQIIEFIHNSFENKKRNFKRLYSPVINNKLGSNKSKILSR